MSQFSNKIIKYLIIIGLIYYIINVVPSQKINYQDIMLLLAVIVGGIILIEYIFTYNNIDTFANIISTTKPVTTMPYVMSEYNPMATPLVMSESNDFMKTSCGVEVDRIKKELADELLKLKSGNNYNDINSGTIADRYLNTLMIELKEKDLLNDFDINNIKLKLKNKVISIMEMITNLENMKKEGVNNNNKTFNNDNNYNELSSDFMKPIGSGIANDWDNDYAILNTNKWTVPMEKPPVCVNSKNDFNPMESSNQVFKLKEWNNSSKITDKLNLNKKWINNS